ncbi:DASH complex subunit Ask1-domain-containing protein [Roridomyces roridus]|uniref:DASH complex subunit ASK1 n=1 Tax=Roridomyces roridus TaxID=1738132 RepID=A0AAD7CJX0_9AGAR|nr:DASH complex subunit Ask1-domain-containing protein [Roridomyces roridus]
MNVPPNPPRWRPNANPADIVVPGLDTTAPILDQIEQMEQLITIKLQHIDENFSKINSVLANKILPAVKRYAADTKPVREAANFWVSFYERAAEIRIPSYDDFSSVNEVPSERDDETEASERTVQSEEHSVVSTENSFMPGHAAFASTPATQRIARTMETFTTNQSDEPSWSASMESPLTRLDRDVQEFSRESSKLPSLRIEEDLPRADKGKEKEHSDTLRQNLLRQNAYSHSDISLSPAKAKTRTPIPKTLNPYLPPDVLPANWSGVVDLRRTPLSTPQRRKKPDLDSDDDDSFNGLPPGMSPPVLMSPARPPRSLAELQLLRGENRTPAKAAALRIKNDLVRDIQRQNSAKIRRFHGYPTDSGGGESSLSTVSTPPSLSRYNKYSDTDDSAVDESLESVMRRVTLDPPAWTPTTSTTPGLRIRSKATLPSADLGPPPASEFFSTPIQYDDGNGSYDSDSDSLDNEVNNTAHPSAAFLMAQAAASSGSFDGDDDSADSLDQEAEMAMGDGVGIHPLAGFVNQGYTGEDDSFDDETFDAGGLPPEETVFGRPPAHRAQAPRMSERGDLLMYGGDDEDTARSAPDTAQFGMVGSSPTPHYTRG